MDATPKTDLAKTLVPFLEPFHKVDGQALKGIWESTAYEATEAIELEFESGFLAFKVDPDDDTVDISFHQARRPDSTSVNDREPWTQLIGKPFGWGWIGINQQGYMDGASFSFGAVTPHFCITAVASHLSLCRLVEVNPLHLQHVKPALEPAPEYA